MCGLRYLAQEAVINTCNKGKLFTAWLDSVSSSVRFMMRKLNFKKIWQSCEIRIYCEIRIKQYDEIIKRFFLCWIRSKKKSDV